ncbi:hypothetical protein QA584_16995 [Anaerocolumna sp. AGMB13025]|uniref:hypothetical protein n=1 Tax=Anaerocolumna sp. AGMB13025 TaxID=3039116 RepID=UPI00241CEB1F|nr:hypothetical protein [Anaerocolumna sp. AGMB13025]WFR55297.1 hypothetical protein QA584_16995 [Anaerocolumna sp. AGMB13025]
MKEKSTRNSIIAGITVMVVNFILLIVGVKIIRSNNIVLQNLAAYTILSVILGVITAIFLYLGLKTAALIFLVGIIIGLFNLFTMFLSEMNGWEDLAGFISYLAWIIIGLIAGLIIQLILYLYHRWKK